MSDLATEAPHQPTRVVFTIPLTPPSVNHYVNHGGGFHRKSAEAKAWERDFALFSRQQYVVSQSGRFRAILEYFLAPGESGDVDNFNKCVLDCAAKAGMFLDGKRKVRSDAWVKEMQVFIRDTQLDREKGPLTRITIEAL